MGDMERILTRVALRSARPRDLTRLLSSLQALPQLRAELRTATALCLTLSEQAGDYPELCDLLGRAIIENPPVVIRDGGVIADGYDQELDELRQISSNAGDYLLEIEQREKQATGISTLKVGYNRVHGYYIEISRAQSDKAPAEYIRRQTLKNAERFITPELKEFEDKALSSKSRALAREKALYEDCWSASTNNWPRCRTPPRRSPKSMCWPTWRSARTTSACASPNSVKSRFSRSSRATPGGGAGSGRALYRQRHPAQRTAAHAADHRAQHGR